MKTKFMQQALYLLVAVIMSFTAYSCGDDNTTILEDKCPSECQANASCDTGSKKCVCDTGYILDGENCVKEVTDACKDVTCQDNATCNEGNCICDNGYVLDGDNCIKEVTDACKDVTCQDNATCDNTNGKCVCDTGYIIDGENCVLNSLCNNITCNENSTCNEDDGKCVCDEGFYYSDILLGCVADEECDNIRCDTGYSCFNGTCYLDDECSIENPNGVCPTIDNQILLACINGLCVTENDGSIEESQPCNPNTNDCVAGTVCVDSFQNNLFKCRAFCDLNTDNSCGDEGACTPYLDDYAQNTGICVKSDIECANNQDTCPDKFQCADMINTVVCKAEGDGKLGAECDNDTNTELSACEDGLFCVGDKDDMTCQELCDPEDAIDTCNNGRCLSLQELDSTSGNNDIGLCLDIPNFCLQSDGIQDNPACTEDDGLCIGNPNESVGMCVVDECDPNNDTCEGELECTRSFTSKNMCILSGDLGYGAQNCVNPQDDNVNPQDLTADKLCSKGLNCVQGSCMELCDPTTANSCVNDSNAICVDINNFIREFPAGINGACVAPQ